MKEELLKTIRERGLLLEKEVFDLVNSFEDPIIARTFLENLERVSGQKRITKSLLVNNYEFVKSAVNDMPGENKEILESTIIRLGLA
jgi:molybdate-binding protein